MKAKWVNIVDSLQGNLDQRHYARRIPGNGEYGAVCAKPELSKKTKKAKAEHPMEEGGRNGEERDEETL